jgi:hypothetical protein
MPEGLMTMLQTFTIRITLTTIRTPMLLPLRAMLMPKLVLAGAAITLASLQSFTLAQRRQALDEQERAKGPRIYRAMKEAGSGRPEVGPTKRTLGAKPGVGRYDDIAVDGNGDVWPNTGGMSVNLLTPCNLPPHKLARSLGGVESNDPTWAIPIALLPQDLSLAPDPGNPLHVYVEPSFRMSLGSYQDSLATTAPFWEKVAE